MKMKRGDIVQIGRHRLMCGDSTSAEDVKALLGVNAPHLVFTSPPYLQQRDYGEASTCWRTMMRSSLADIPHLSNTQILVNIGLVHKNAEWCPYWENWVEDMRKKGWRRFGWYVWDKMEALPGCWRGRLAPSFEFIFHFNRISRIANKVVKCKHAGHIRKRHDRGFIGAQWGQSSWKFGAESETGSSKISDATVRLSPEKARSKRPRHPAPFPVALAERIILSWTSPEEIAYDPFSGSGTSMVAAEKNQRISLAMEKNPNYCDMIIRRMQDTFGLTAQPA